jgi:hypothetical protein
VPIERGRDWGEPAVVPDGIDRAAGDAALGDLVAAGATAAVLLGGDLYRTLGGGAAPATGAAATRLPVDVLAVDLDGEQFVAVAHVLVREPWWRGGWWRGPLVAVCNAQYLGAYDLAPRGHPGDGRAEVIEVAADLGLRARWQARRRLPTGAHLPHPRIRATSVAEHVLERTRPAVVQVDGRRRRSRRVRVTVRPDAVAVYR